MADCEISGEVFAAAISYVETTHGPKMWKKITGELSKQLKGLKIEAQGRYDFSLFSTVVQTASRLLKTGPTEFVEAVGFFWISHLSQNPKLESLFLSMGSNFSSALHSLNSLHNTVSQSGLYPNLSCPQLEILSEKQGWMKCLYTPGAAIRCGLLQHLMAGIITGLGYDFFELSYVDVQICEERPGPITTYVLEVTYSADDSSSSSSEGSLTPTSSFSETPIHLDTFHINSLFPFHFIVDKAGEIMEGGPSFCKCFEELIGQPAASFINITYPNNVSGRLFDVATISHLSFTMDMCCFVVDGVEMRGQVLNQNGILVFLMNPVFKSVDEMVKRGLAISDFAFHDTGISLVYSSLSMETAARKYGKLGKASTDSKIKLMKEQGKKKKKDLGSKIKRSPSAQQSTSFSATTISASECSPRNFSSSFSPNPPSFSVSAPVHQKCPFSSTSSPLPKEKNGAPNSENGAKMLSLGELPLSEEAKDPFHVFCNALYRDSRAGFPFILKLLSFSEGSYEDQEVLAQAMFDFYCETGKGAAIIEKCLKKDLLKEAGPAYLRGNSTGIHLMNLFLRRYAGNFISSFCEDLSSLLKEKKEKHEKGDDYEKLTSFLRKRIETHLNPQVCQLLLWIFNTVKEAHSEEAAGLALTNFFFLRFILARMVVVSPDTKDFAKRIQKECHPIHPLVPEILEICAKKPYQETDEMANDFRKKLSSRHTAGAETLQKACNEYMGDLMGTEEGIEFFGPILSAAIRF